MWIDFFDYVSQEMFVQLLWWFLLLYGVSFLSLLFSSWRLRLRHPLRRFNRVLARYQRLFKELRFLCSGLLGLWFAWAASSLFMSWSWQHLLFPLTALLLLLIELRARKLHKQRSKQLLRELRDLQTVDPKVFYQALLETHGPWPLGHYVEQKRFGHEIDFRNSTKFSNTLIWLKGMLCTYRTARLILFWHKEEGKEALSRVVPALAVVWSLYLLQLIRARVHCAPSENLKNFAKAPQRIWSFQHQSLFDFVVAPLMCLFAKKADGKLFDLPCFLLAKDHFLDNIFVHRFLGIGKVAEALGMVFVERKAKNAVTAERAVEQAVAVLGQKRSLGIFPQGTRSWPQYDAKGDVLGASFFVVGSHKRMHIPFSHLKPGLARMVLGSLRRAKHEFSHMEVAVLPVAFVGIAKVLPKYALKIKPKQSIEVKIAELHHFDKALLRFNDSEAIQEIQTKLTRSFMTILNLETDLERRFFEFFGKQQNMHMLNVVNVAFKAARGKDPTLYMILDAIYTCKAQHWSAMQAQFAEKIIEVASHEELLEFYQEVVTHIGKK